MKKAKKSKPSQNKEMDYEKIYQGAIECWGVEAQMEMVIEECAELIEACSHVLRRREGAIFELIEETVDVENMIEQMKRIYASGEGLSTVYELKKIEKMDRVWKMIQEHRRKHGEGKARMPEVRGLSLEDKEKTPGMGM